ncbi:MAG: signal peptidase II [Firmicutes bacterium]|nr:signal peptidase II [Bacillota bacterium]HPU01065.1 signal peptidase II [Bacillota bacterium]
MLFFLIVAGIVAVDQLSKYLVALHMEVGQSIPLIKNVLAITYVRNPGAAFGLLPYRTIFFIVVTLLVMGMIIYYYRVLPAGYWLLRLGLALQLGGAIGNFIDRVRHSSVVDFIDVKFFPPVFNLADTAIVLGVVLFLFAFWRLSPSLESRQQEPE